MRSKRPRKSRFRSAISTLSVEDLDNVTFRDTEVLNLFISGQGKILPRRKTHISARHQRRIAKAVKHARQLGLLGYRGQHH